MLTESKYIKTIFFLKKKNAKLCYGCARETKSFFFIDFTIYIWAIYGEVEAQLNIIPKVEDLCVYNGILYSVRFLMYRICCVLYYYLSRVFEFGASTCSSIVA